MIEFLSEMIVGAIGVWTFYVVPLQIRRGTS